MTADERDTIRAAVDEAKRQKIAELSEYEARRRRLFRACCEGGPVRRSNQVRAVMAMLDQSARKASLR